MKNKIHLYNPISAKVDNILMVIKQSLTSFLLPSSQQDFISNSISQLMDSIPVFDYSSDKSSVSNSQFDKFWHFWMPFREVVLEHSSHSVLEFAHMFLTEKFDDIDDIIRAIAVSQPSKIPQKREYDIYREKLQKSMLALQQLLLQQFNDEVDPSLQIKNLSNQRTRIRRMKTDISNKFATLFSSIQKEDLMNQLLSIFEEILVMINDLPKQKDSIRRLRSELIIAEEHLYEMFPPSPTIDIVPIEEESINDELSSNEKLETSEKNEISKPTIVEPSTPRKRNRISSSPLTQAYESSIKPLNLADDELTSEMDLNLNSSDSDEQVITRTRSGVPRKNSIPALPNTSLRSIPPQAVPKGFRKRADSTNASQQISIENEKLKTELQQYINENEILHINMEQFQNEIKQLQIQQKALDENYREKSSEVSILSDQIEKLQKDNNICNRKIEEYMIERESYLEQIKSQTNTISELREALDDIPLQMIEPAPFKVEHNSEGSESEDEYDDDMALSNRIAFLEKERAELYETIDHLTDENIQLKAAQNEEVISKLETELNILKERNSVFAEINELLETENQRKSTLINTFINQNDTHTIAFVDNNEIISELKNSKEEIAYLRKTIANLNIRSTVESQKVLDYSLESLLNENAELKEKIQEKEQIIQSQREKIAQNGLISSFEDVKRFEFIRNSYLDTQIALLKSELELKLAKNHPELKPTQNKSTELQDIRNNFENALYWGYEKAQELAKLGASADLLAFRLSLSQTKDIDKSIKNELKSLYLKIKELSYEKESIIAAIQKICSSIGYDGDLSQCLSFLKSSCQRK